MIQLDPMIANELRSDTGLSLAYVLSSGELALVSFHDDHSNSSGWFYILVLGRGWKFRLSARFDISSLAYWLKEHNAVQSLGLGYWDQAGSGY